MEMMRSVRALAEEDDEDEEFPAKDASSPKGDFGGKSDGKVNARRANTPRSKHSATEQRRRRKINDRFQILRELIPNSNDQRRDKASFLLEVIDHIQFLQEKVQKYEMDFPGWNQNGMKMATWKNNQGSIKADHSRLLKNDHGPGLMFDDNNIAATPAMLSTAQSLVEIDSLNEGSAYKQMDHHLGLSGKGVPLPMTSHQNMYAASVGRSGGLGQLPQRLVSDPENMSTQIHPQLWPNSFQTENDILSEQEELTIEGGTIRISSVYSQGLLSSLAQALQISGLDLSQASISVQIDIGKRAINQASITKDHDEPSSSNRAMTHSRVGSSGDDSDQAQKRFKMDNTL